MPPDPLAIDLAWDTVHTLIGGASAIDVPRLHVSSLAEAEDFLHCYGYDWLNIQHRTEMERIRAESLSFIESELLDESGPQLPDEFREETDVRRLLLFASGDPSATRQRWACSILRVMHTFSHSHSYFNDRFGEQIRRQILDRFEPHLRLTDSGWSLGHGSMSIPLTKFEFKPVKPKHSLVLKLLHKPENVAADVFDRIGLRFVTKERFDAVLVVKYLTENSVIMFANGKPSRSRNTLIDMDWLQEEILRLMEEMRAGRMQRYGMVDELRKRVAAQPYPSGPAPSYNPYSALAYHSIQFTCRQMVRVTNPYAGDLLVRMARLGLDTETMQEAITDVTAGLERQEEIRFFFPFEVQILDSSSYSLTRSGLASHDEYKSRQRDAVRRRVLGTLVD